MSRRGAAALAALALAGAGCAMKHAAVEAPAHGAGLRSRVTVRDCEPADVERWSRLRCASLGVAAEDSARSLDPVPAVRGRAAPPSVLVREGNAVDGFHTWVPVSGLKETACGRPQAYEENCATRLGLFAECDLNNDVRPDPGSLLAQYLELMQCRLDDDEPDDVWPGEEPAFCFDRDVLHAEITPPQAPAVSPYGLRRELRRLWRTGPGRDAWQAQLWDGRLCVYGPFVGDRGHNFQPEIHPVQLAWWNLWPADRCRQARGPDGPFALLLLQDASSRFAQPHHFYLRDRPAERWRPWAAGPLDGTFHIAFWARRDEPPTFTVAPLFGAAPATGAPREVVDQRGDVIARLDDTRLRGELPGYARVEVGVERACRDPEDDALLGVLRVRARADTGREWEEGHAALRVSDSRAAAVAAAALAASVHTVADDAHAAGSGEATAASGAVTPAAGEVGTASAVGDDPTESEHAHEAALSARGDIGDAPPTDEARPRAGRVASGSAGGCTEMCPEGRKTGSTSQPGEPAFEPRIVLRDDRWERVGTAAADPLARRARAAMLVALAGSEVRERLSALPDVPVVALRRFVLHVDDVFEAAGHEDTTTLDRDPPPSHAWDVSLRDVESGAPPEAAHARVTPRGADCVVEIDGGQPGAVYEVAATVRVSGRFTDTRAGARRVWSFERTRRQRLWTHALAMTGGVADARRLTRLLRARDAPRNRDYDRLLDLAATRAVADGRVSVSELRLLARQAGVLFRAKRAVPLERDAPLDDTLP